MRKAAQEEIYKCRAQSLREDVIVRHVERLDNYPNVDDESKGISPWFRVGLVDTYERGIILCLRVGGLKQTEEGYRFVDYINGEKSDITAWLLANVPYDSIVEINFDGDGYYPYPHIFCHFDFDSEPYEKKWLAEKIVQPHGHPYFRELAIYDDVRQKDTEGQLWFG